ncbi:hypothetical protein DPQ33_02150 [Oceanidesulfovibrio indonesiensis]|uniref:Uncharacterized protein n=1 Tax=Oceanidesulfovibrio indonesiensis TaxID=54767 RepID=A0A7M3MHL7_9BACT|nr:hypothetical protein [Oceanidesulfovibrio indonesiensis]TVM19182.1 hypothetical protein DPQ33_02150 [Oceanidesulfovibrio indonesiensis]
MVSMTTKDKKSAQREAIAEAAAAVFAGTTVAETAARAGVDKCSVYEYYAICSLRSSNGSWGSWPMQCRPGRQPAHRPWSGCWDFRKQ